MFAQERQHRTLELLRKRRRVSVPELERLFGASPATIRRDLSFLEQAGQVLRTHGGILAPDHGGGEVAYDRKRRQALSAKAAIAERAAALVRDGDTVFVDSGTTAFGVGRRLLGRPGVTVFTNSVPLLAAAQAPGCRLVSVGGEVRTVSLALVGAVALEWLGRVRFDLCFLGTSGIDPAAGPTTTEFGEAGVKAAALRVGRRVVLLADASKWGRPAAIRFAGWADIGDLVTDHRPGPAEQRLLARHGVALHPARR
jgi:DeoR/GlpR family transcriptional regulator of sugar metabolism